MLALTLQREAGVVVRIKTPLGDIVIAVLDSSSGRTRLGFSASRELKIDRIDLSTGEVVYRPEPDPDSHSLTDGVAEATLACTGSSSEPVRSKDAPSTAGPAGPLVRLGQGTYERALTGHELAERRTLSAVVDAVA